MSYGGPRHGAPVVAPLCPTACCKAQAPSRVWGIIYKPSTVSCCSERLRRGTLILLFPSEPSTHLRIKRSAAAGHICQLGAFLCKSQGDGPPFFLTKLCTALTWLWTLPQVSVQFSKLSHRRKFLCVSRERVQPFWGPREALRKRWGWCLHAEQLSSFLLLHERCYEPQRWMTTPAIKSWNTSKLKLFVPGQFCLTD